MRLDRLPHDRGIYTLHDHTGTIRYTGITKSVDSGFYDRIHNRHVTGSEGRSHKFSHAYNTGRMWCDKRDARCQLGESIANGVDQAPLSSEFRNGASITLDRTA